MRNETEEAKIIGELLGIDLMFNVKNKVWHAATVDEVILLHYDTFLWNKLLELAGKMWTESVSGKFN